jgi:hypothetical protein
MRRWIFAAATLAVAASSAAATADAASCGPRTSRKCLDAPSTINFGSVSDISKQIVSEEPGVAKPSTQTLEAPPITTYTGPTVGVNTMVRAPTVGYYWSLEPETDTH